MDTTKLINDLFDHLREEHGLTSDEQLRPYLGGVSDTQIWRWRDGQLGKIGPVLFPLILKYHDVLTAELVEA
jgi:hypothetical protein